MTPRTLRTVHRAVIRCEACPRLRAYCKLVARERKAAYRTETYWGRPVPGFGDPRARLLVLGLAPAAHGANRTGRMFTGDGRGGSGDFLMRAMHAAGFANKPTSERTGDGLALTDAYILAAVRCAPPGNKPTRDEILRCYQHLDAEIAALPNLQVVIALGRLASEAYWRLLAGRGVHIRPRPPFAHGQVVRPPHRDAPVLAGRGASAAPPDAHLRAPKLDSNASSFGFPRVLVESYHPSRQNTQTGKLTPRMLDDVFRKARRLLR